MCRAWAALPMQMYQVEGGRHPLLGRAATEVILMVGQVPAVLAEAAGLPARARARAVVPVAAAAPADS